MKVLTILRNIYKEHRILYTIAFLLIIASAALKLTLPYLGFLTLFATFCAICCIIYGLLLYAESHCKKQLSKAARALRFAALGLIAIFLVSFITIESLIIYNIKDEDTPREYLIVLGGGINGTQPSLALANRLERAIEYLNKYPNAVAILSGGQGDGEIITEADAMSRYMQKNGIGKNRLILDENSYDTRQNIRNAYNIIQEESGNARFASVAVVSNDFHLFRSKIIMKKQGFTNISTLSSPTPTVLLNICLFIREYFSVILEQFNI